MAIIFLELVKFKKKFIPINEILFWSWRKSFCSGLKGNSRIELLVILIGYRFDSIPQIKNTNFSLYIFEMWLKNLLVKWKVPGFIDKNKNI